MHLALGKGSSGLCSDSFPQRAATSSEMIEERHRRKSGVSGSRTDFVISAVIS